MGILAISNISKTAKASFPSKHLLVRNSLNLGLGFINLDWLKGQNCFFSVKMIK